ncbi:MAG: aldolase/citrate lyase family protein, partial [Acidimicrobiia bacterium]
MTSHDHLKHLVSGSDRAQIGMWLATGDPVAAEICAAAGLDWLVVDTEHAPNDLRSVLRHLQVLAGYRVCPVVRPAVADSVLLKQLLDIGARNFIVPMIDSAEAAASVVRAVRYPPRGVRGVGATLARSSRWGLVDDYFDHADDDVTVIVQAETTAAL